MNAKSGNLHVHVVPYVKAACMQIMIGFKVKDINWFVLNKLKRGEPCSCPSLSHGSEATALAFSLYKFILTKMNASAGVQEKTKAVNIQCYTQNGVFFITMQTISNGSALRKVLSSVEKCFVPESLYAYYKYCITLLNGKPSKEEFAYVANQLRDSLKDVTCVASGKINMTKDTLSAIVQSAASKYKSDFKKLSGETKPMSLSAEPGESSYPHLSAKKMNVTFVADFLRNNTQELVVVNSEKVLVYRQNWKPSASLDAHKVDFWIKRNYEKIHDLKPALIYISMIRGDVDPETICDFIDQKFTLSDLSSAIKSALKD
jgi:hypothetical protein